MAEPDAADRDPVKGFLYALSAVVILSMTTYIFSKYAMDVERGGVRPVTFAFAWTGAATVYLFVLLAVRGRIRELWLPRGARARMVAMGVLSGLAHILFWLGLSRLNAAFTSFLMRFMSVLVILGCVAFLGERVKRLEVVAIGVMLVGGCISSVGAWRVAGPGILLIGLATLAGAAWRVMAKAGAAQVPPMVGNFYRVAFAAVLIGGWAAGTGRLDFTGHADRWAVLFIGALLGPCIGMSLMFASYRYWDLSKTSMIVMAEPLIVLPASLLLPGRPLSLQQLIGGLIILVGGFWLAWTHRRRRLLSSPPEPIE